MRTLHISSMLAAVLLALAFSAQAASPLLKELEACYVELHERVGPSVVNIEVKGTVREHVAVPMDDLFRYFGMPAPKDVRPRGTGSGFIYDRDGHIITNNHVVEDANEITVRLHNGNEYEAEVLGTDPEGDLAVIKIDTDERLSVARLGTSKGLKTGQFVVAIGSARGFDGTVSFGHISAVGREGLRGLEVQGLVFQHLIQTDAAINLGNSGGPLINIDGEVVGINTAIVFGANSIGFAIPVDTAKEVVPQLISQGKVTRGYLGVGIKDARLFADAIDLPDPSGAIVDRVQPDTPASRADLRTYDVIRKVNGIEVEDATDLVRRISSFPPDTTVTLEIWRDGATLDVEVDLDERDLVTTSSHRGKSVLGMRVRNLIPGMAERIGISEETKGALVVGVETGSAADDAGIREGDVITEIAQESVENTEDFHRLVKENAKPGKSLLIRFVRGDNEPEILVIKVPKEDE